MTLINSFIIDVWKQNIQDFKEFGELAKQANCTTGKMYFRGLQYQCLLFIPVYYIPILYILSVLPLAVIFSAINNTITDTIILTAAVAMITLFMIIFVVFARLIKTKGHPQMKKNLIEKFIDEKPVKKVK
ncbi:hypothetical protein [Halalkalibacter krulwichiae]|uniref:Uncharacterized protein n=1 Tax=Halalkalibacter krulwichiae TaxID=199441 RepID=A0A1X9MJL5_9BACI|nr:hypothetical protein [Halalkalibacter krulwichiae]ARK32880.1 hypothetical protein BkAM31D_25105 [Halalkalibacter krulwichiae]